MWLALYMCGLFYQGTVHIFTKIHVKYEQIFMACFNYLANAFSYGAPAKTCMDLLPKHHLEQQTSPSPYEITLSQLQYSPGDIITSEIS